MRFDLAELMKANPELAVDKRFSTVEAVATPARKELRQAKVEHLEHGFDTLWIQAGGEPDFWHKATISGFGKPYEETYELDRFNKSYRVAVEVQGGQYMAKSGHSNIKGLGRDARKLWRCNQLNITLFHMPNELVTFEWVEKLLKDINRIVAVI